MKGRTKNLITQAGEIRDFLNSYFENNIEETQYSDQCISENRCSPLCQAHGCIREKIGQLENAIADMGRVD